MLCVSPALAAPTQKIKTKFGQFLLGAFISHGLTLCVSVCVIVVGLSVSRAVHPELSLIGKFSVYLWHEIQTTMHLYSFTENPPKQNTRDTGKNRNSVFFYCVGLSDQPHWREGTPKPSFDVLMIIMEKIVQSRFSLGLYLLANKCRNIWFTIYIF